MNIPRISLGWFRFTLREVFLLMLAVGVGLCWWREFRFAAPMREAMAEMNSGGPRPFGSSRRKVGGVMFTVFALEDDALGAYEMEVSFTPKPVSADVGSTEDDPQK